MNSNGVRIQRWIKTGKHVFEADFSEDKLIGSPTSETLYDTRRIHLLRVPLHMARGQIQQKPPPNTPSRYSLAAKTTF